MQNLLNDEENADNHDVENTDEIPEGFEPITEPETSEPMETALETEITAESTKNLPKTEPINFNDIPETPKNSNETPDFEEDIFGTDEPQKSGEPTPNQTETDKENERVRKERAKKIARLGIKIIDTVGSKLAEKLLKYEEKSLKLETDEEKMLIEAAIPVVEDMMKNADVSPLTLLLITAAAVYTPKVIIAENGKSKPSKKDFTDFTEVKDEKQPKKDKPTIKNNDTNTIKRRVGRPSKTAKKTPVFPLSDRRTANG